MSWSFIISILLHTGFKCIGKTYSSCSPEMLNHNRSTGSQSLVYPTQVGLKDLRCILKPKLTIMLATSCSRRVSHPSDLGRMYWCRSTYKISNESVSSGHVEKRASTVYAIGQCIVVGSMDLRRQADSSPGRNVKHRWKSTACSRQYWPAWAVVLQIELWWRELLPLADSLADGRSGFAKHRDNFRRAWHCRIAPRWSLPYMPLYD